MFKRILVANRGEVALRVIRAAHELGIEAAVVYSEADRDSLPVKLADYAICVGPGAPLQSYLNVANIMSAAKLVKAEAIHPGYGFLAESAFFAEIVERHGMKFIGPTPENIKTVGDKVFARKVAARVGVPVLPGSLEPVTDEREAKRILREVGFPVVLKAAGGGGGRGIRLIRSFDEFERVFHLMQAEAQAAFGDPRIFIEKFLPKARHIEVQIIGDSYGNVICFAERNCSMQRRHQKIIEETPSPLLGERERRQLMEWASRLAKEVRYENTGTFEFLADEKNNFFFIEANTRLQVEHTVTEEIYRFDIVKEQIRVAAGCRLSKTQEELKPEGHAVEVRITAEDWKNGFRASTGTLTRVAMPGGPGIRVDTHIFAGYVVPPFYDSLLAKVIAKGENRQEAISRMRRALDETIIEGVETNVGLLKLLMEDKAFVRGFYHTRYLEERLPYLAGKEKT